MTRHPFYEQLNKLLDQAGLDTFCKVQGAVLRRRDGPSVDPVGGVLPDADDRVLRGGGQHNERQIAWRCADSLSPRSFLGIPPGEATPDHWSLSRTQQRVEVETHQAVFDRLLKRLAEHGLLKGKTIGIDATTMEANTAMRSIVRKDTWQTYREYLTELARASGIETLTAEDLAKSD